jgi:hypothetical protein
MGLMWIRPEQSWMSFVDGENFTIRAQNLAKKANVSLIEGPYFKQDCFVWIPGFNAWLIETAQNQRVHELVPAAGRHR